jgi:hypothetical protein
LVEQFHLADFGLIRKSRLVDLITPHDHAKQKIGAAKVPKKYFPKKIVFFNLSAQKGREGVRFVKLDHENAIKHENREPPRFPTAVYLQYVCKFSFALCFYPIIIII